MGSKELFPSVYIYDIKCQPYLSLDKKYNLFVLGP